MAVGMLVLGASASAAQPFAISLMRGGDDRLTSGLVDAIHVSAPAAGVVFAQPGTPGSVPVELGIPRSHGRYRFMMPVGQPKEKLGRPVRFSGFRVHCDRRRQDICAGSVLAEFDKRFKGRG
jgi:hypothetical protein